ncbi:copper transporter [Fulvitalea axinellae]|uniref:Copper transporter n=1 Tax=Fulvitalea axinellae TaxID=1182444 RepID=A0AAU9CDJ9_9BACT|nr:copper transporter [Fulvitalea axinellae]
MEEVLKEKEPKIEGDGKSKKMLKEFGLTSLALRNSATVYVVTLLIVVFGVISYVTLPKENFPELDIPKAYVGTAYPGNSPADMENLVTRPIERYVKLEKGVDKITSVSIDGYSAITVDFETDVTKEEARDRVKNAVDKAKVDLPKDLPADPDVQEIDMSALPILNVSFSGPYTKDKLRDFAKILKDEVERFPEISKGEIKGVDDREVHINIDPYKMEAREVSFNDIEQAIQSENMNMSAGDIIKDGIRRSVRVAGEYADPTLMADVVVKREKGKPVYIRDIGTVDYTYVDQESYAKVNANEVVTLDVVKRGGKNLLIATEKVNNLLKELKGSVFPKDLEIAVTGDQSTITRENVSNLENNIISGVILVVLVLLFFLNTRNALFVGVAIPLSMLMSFLILSVFGININMMVLFALIMALGMLVDNGIVVVENVYRLMEEGYKPMDAAKYGVGEVAWPIISSTATTLAAFIPLALWPGMMGEFMKYLPITLMITLSCSLFVALVVNPVLIMHFMEVRDGKPEPVKRKVLVLALALIVAGGLLIAGGVNVFGNLFGVGGALILLDAYVLNRGSYTFQTRLLPIIEGYYERTLKFALRKPFLFFGGALGLLILTFNLYFGVFPPKVLYFPETNPAQAMVYIEYPIGADIEKTIKLTNELEGKVMKVIEPYRHMVKSVVTSAGTSSGDPQTEAVSTGSTPHKGRIIVNFEEFKRRNGISTSAVLDSIRTVTTGYAGVSVTADKNSDGPPAGKPIQLEISGRDLATLVDVSERFITFINNSGIQGIEQLKSDLEVGKPEYLVNVDREKARFYGLSTAQVGEELRTSLFGKKVSTFKEDIDDWDVKLRLAEPYRYDVEALKNRLITFQNKQGKIIQVPVSSVADFKLSSTYGSIRRKDQKRMVTISSNVLNGYNANEINMQIQEALERFDIPQGYKVEFGGEQEKQKEEMAFLSQALLLAVFMIFLIIVAQFNQVTTPFIIMTSVLFSTIGVFLGLMVFKMDFIVIMTMLGIISLAGIVVNNAIVLLDYTNLLKDRLRAKLGEGEELTVEMVREQIVKAGKTRLRPVLLTAITTVLGLIPLAVGINIDFLNYLSHFDFAFYIGGDNVVFWGPMSWTIIFGLTFATFLTLVIVPVMYLLVEKGKKFVGVKL